MAAHTGQDYLINVVRNGARPFFGPTRRVVPGSHTSTHARSATPTAAAPETTSGAATSPKPSAPPELSAERASTPRHSASSRAADAFTPGESITHETLAPIELTPASRPDHTSHEQINAQPPTNHEQAATQVQSATQVQLATQVQSATQAQTSTQQQSTSQEQAATLKQAEDEIALAGSFQSHSRAVSGSPEGHERASGVESHTSSAYIENVKPDEASTQIGTGSAREWNEADDGRRIVETLPVELTPADSQSATRAGKPSDVRQAAWCDLSPVPSYAAAEESTMEDEARRGSASSRIRVNAAESRTTPDFNGGGSIDVTLSGVEPRPRAQPMWESHAPDMPQPTFANEIRSTVEEYRAVESSREFDTSEASGAQSSSAAAASHSANSAPSAPRAGSPPYVTDSSLTDYVTDSPLDDKGSPDDKGSTKDGSSHTHDHEPMPKARGDASLASLQHEEWARAGGRAEARLDKQRQRDEQKRPDGQKQLHGQKRPDEHDRAVPLLRHMRGETVVLLPRLFEQTGRTSHREQNLASVTDTRKSEDEKGRGGETSRRGSQPVEGEVSFSSESGSVNASFGSLKMRDAMAGVDLRGAEVARGDSAEVSRATSGMSPGATSEVSLGGMSEVSPSGTSEVSPSEASRVQPGKVSEVRPGTSSGVKPDMSVGAEPRSAEQSYRINLAGESYRISQVEESYPVNPVGDSYRISSAGENPPVGKLITEREPSPSSRVRGAMNASALQAAPVQKAAAMAARTGAMPVRTVASASAQIRAGGSVRGREGARAAREESGGNATELLPAEARGTRAVEGRAGREASANVTPKVTINRLDVRIVNQTPPVPAPPAATAPAQEPKHDNWESMDRGHLGRLFLL
jgi:hypothetical protein